MDDDAKEVALCDDHLVGAARQRGRLQSGHRGPHRFEIALVGPGDHERHHTAEHQATDVRDRRDDVSIELVRPRLLDQERHQIQRRRLPERHDVSAGASSPLDESQKLELVNRRAQGVSIDIELLGQLALGRQPFPWRVLARKDRGAQLASGPIAQIFLRQRRIAPWLWSVGHDPPIASAVVGLFHQFSGTVKLDVKPALPATRGGRTSTCDWRAVSDSLLARADHRSATDREGPHDHRPHRPRPRAPRRVPAHRVRPHRPQDRPTRDAHRVVLRRARRADRRTHPAHQLPDVGPFPRSLGDHPDPGSRRSSGERHRDAPRRVLRVDATGAVRPVPVAQVQRHSSRCAP